MAKYYWWISYCWNEGEQTVFQSTVSPDHPFVAIKNVSERTKGTPFKTDLTLLNYKQINEKEYHLFIKLFSKKQSTENHEG